MNGEFLRIDNLSVGYGKKVLISELCASLPRGKILTLIGPNGSGKSTILKSISNQLKIMGGSVCLDGKDLTRTDVKTLARSMAVVLTERVKTQWQTCRQIVAAGRYPYTGMFGRLSERDESIVNESMRACNVQDLAERDFCAVSDGQRQRVLLARALCQQPKVMMLDEPTSYLDIRHKVELLDLLRKSAREDDLTIVLSLHELEIAGKFSDLILCVADDRSVRMGTTEEMFRSDALARLYGMDERIYNPLLGSVELPAAQGTPQVFVIAGAGSGAAHYRALQRRNIPFASGILHEGDVDYEIARALSGEVVAERAFCPIAPQTYERALAGMEACPVVLDARPPAGAINAKNAELLQAAQKAGKRIVTEVAQL